MGPHSSVTSLRLASVSPLDVALGHGQAGMAGELLHVPEAAPDLRHFARGAGNEGPAS